MRIKIIALFINVYMLFAINLFGQSNVTADQKNSSDISMPMKDKIIKTETEWKTCRTPEQYEVLREKGTEYPFTGERVFGPLFAQHLVLFGSAAGFPLGFCFNDFIFHRHGNIR